MRAVLLITIGVMLGVGFWLIIGRPTRTTWPVWHEGHGDDPNLVNDVFGKPGAWFGKSGYEISHPWQTFKADSGLSINDVLEMGGDGGFMENDMKHEGYMWKVGRDLPCDDKGYCVKAFRVQYHFHPTMDMNVRWHSASLEIQVCKNPNEPNTCGIIRTGGWFDFGYLYRPEYEIDCKKQQNRVETEFDKQFVLAEAETKSDLVDEMRCHPTRDPVAIWWGHGGSDLRFQLRVPKVGKTDLKIAYFLPINKYYVHGYTKDEVVNLPLGVRYINRFGQLVTGCKGVEMDCIPIEYSNVYLSGNIENEVVGFRQIDKISP